MEMMGNARFLWLSVSLQQRFTAAMEGRSERIPYPVVKVSPADVQASGLLKDKIVLQAPTEGAAVYNIYLNDACKTLVQSTALWQMYCEQKTMRRWLGR